MKKYLVLAGIALLCGCNSKSQETNFKEIFSLDKDHSEVSGMVFHHETQKLWMLQDKGNPSELYVYSPEGTFERTITLNNQENTDWEDLSQDTNGNLYVGNFGNNRNDRKDLRILKLNSDELTNQSVNVSQITTFHYEDQNNFPPKKGNLMYDCEAFVATNDAFYLFTKNRSKGFDGTFYVYKVPNKTGNFEAKKIATLNSGNKYRTSAITGASINKEGNKIALVTHNKILLIPFNGDSSFTQQNISTIELGHESQKEAVAFKNEKEIYIADENEKGGNNGKVYILGLN